MKKTEKQQNALKGVMLPFEKFGCLRNLPVDEAGEIIQTVLAYGMDGTKPEFKDKYQQRYYESFLAPITEQIANAEKRAVQCREAAQQRADALKAAKKIIAMQERETKAAIAYVKQNITNNASKRNTLYASKFLGSNVWKTKA